MYETLSKYCRNCMKHCQNSVYSDISLCRLLAPSFFCFKVKPEVKFPSCLLFLNIFDLCCQILLKNQQKSIYYNRRYNKEAYIFIFVWFKINYVMRVFSYHVHWPQHHSLKASNNHHKHAPKMMITNFPNEHICEIKHS